MTTAKTSLVQMLLLDTYCTITFIYSEESLYVVKFASIGCVTVLLQAFKVDSLTAKFGFYYFLCTSLTLACGLWLNCFVYLVFL